MEELETQKNITICCNKSQREMYMNKNVYNEPRLQIYKKRGKLFW